MKKRIITNEQINDFKLYLYEEERSENTIAKYIRDILSFSQRIGSKRLEKTDMLEYKKELCEKYAPRSVNSILSAINMFFAFLGWHELKVRTLKIQRQIFAEKSKELTKAEYARLLIAAKRNNNSRLYYLLQTMAGTGIRVGKIDEDGFLFITGRIKNIIILSNGENVSPEAIENRIYRCGIIDEAVAYAENDEIHLGVYCEDMNKEKQEEIEEFIKAYNKSVPTYHRIKKIDFRDKPFEKTASNKIKRPKKVSEKC